MILWTLGDALAIFDVLAVICLILIEIGGISGMQGMLRMLECDDSGLIVGLMSGTPD
jgi:hypothetical protein